MKWAELGADLLRRVLVTTGFEYCDMLFWRQDDGVLSMFVLCSDTFDYACADAEPIESEADVVLLETCLADLRAATGDTYPLWLGELYVARRRRMRPLAALLNPDSPHSVGQDALPLFLAAGPPRPD